MAYREPIKVVADIVAHELNFDKKKMWIWNQNFQLPHITGAFIILNEIDSKEKGSEKKYELDESNILQEKISLLSWKRAIISIMSRNNEARLRYNEIKVALLSAYSIEMQAKYAVGIDFNTNKNFTNASMAEGGSLINRYDIEISYHSTYYNKKDVAYYDKFPLSIISED